MKRKRGHKKSKSKKKLLLIAETTSSNHSEEMSPNSEENSGSEEENYDDKLEPEAKSPVRKVESEPDKVEKEVVCVRPIEGVIQRPPTTAVYGRVKVKLKTSKPIVVESQKVPSSEGPSVRNDADKRSQEVVVNVDRLVSVPVAEEGEQQQQQQQLLPKCVPLLRAEKEQQQQQQQQLLPKCVPLLRAEKGEQQQQQQIPKCEQQQQQQRQLLPKCVPLLRAEKGEQQQQQEQMPKSFLLSRAEKGEDSSASSLQPESKKIGGIKIVSGAGMGVSPPGRKESSPNGLVLLEEKKKEEQEVKVAHRGSRYNKKELEASLEVVKKVMKMDAAEPFNKPVNPIALGIPDYFDIIDTPMDFGTVRNNLESGAKFMNSEDVYKDVQYIWNNCYKYNNKGDYIVDLMKRVKKNFMKYWVAAGLYTEQTWKQTGGEGTPMDEATTSGHGKKFKRGKGVKRHKDDCMCAICIMKRRRKEREAREAGAQATSPRTEVGKTGLPQEYKQEENSHIESPFGGDTSSYLETSPDADGDAEIVDGEETRLEDVPLQYDYEEQKVEENRVEFRDKSDRSGDISDRSQRSDKVDTESNAHVETKIQDESANGAKHHPQGQPLVQPDGQITEHMRQRRELLEQEKKRQKLRLLETFRDLENPMLSELCSTLFPSNPQSVWNGAHSLVRSHKTHNKRSGIHDAIASFMTPSYKSSPSLK